MEAEGFPQGPVTWVENPRKGVFAMLTATLLGLSFLGLLGALLKLALHLTGALGAALI